MIEIPFSFKELVKKLNLFKRNKKRFETKVLCLIDYIILSSLRKTAKKVSTFTENISKSSVHRYVKAFRKKIESIFYTEKPKEHRIIAIDETCLKVNGRKIYVYSAVNAENNEIIYMKAFPLRNYLITLKFLKGVLERCKSKPELILIDKGPWLINAVKRVGLRYKHETFGRRNCVERVFGYLKDRSKIFYHNVA